MNRNKALLTLLFIICLTVKSYSQVDSVRNFLIEALDSMKTHSYNRNQIDWEKMYIQTLDAAKDVKDIHSLAPTIDKAISQLMDSHSLYYQMDPEEKDQDIESLYATVTYAEAGRDFPVIESKIIKGKYAYINFPGVVLENRRYADVMLDSLKSLDKHNPEGWIIDLRDNDGGNFYPMYTGLIPFLNTDTTFALSDADGNLTYEYTHRNRLYTNESRFAKLANIDSIQAFELVNREKPIVVLVSERTASSGEFSTVTLMGQENTVVIGTKTAGLTSSNELYLLSNGSGLNLTVGVLKDRRGKVYRIAESIIPDILLDLTETEESESIDALYMNKAMEVLDAG